MSMSGSKGGIYESNVDCMGDDIDIVRYWKAAGQKEMSGKELYQKLRLKAQPIQLEVGIGNDCGMACQHCYLGYQAGAMEASMVPMPKLLATVTEMVEKLDTRMICVADRDALTPKRSLPFFQHLAQLRHQYPSLKFGGVTNGIRMPEFAEPLSRLPLDYIDISIDGARHEHDTIRGVGRFDQAIENLRLAHKHRVAERVIVAHTLTRYNDDSLLHLIHNLITNSDLVDFLESLATSLQPLQMDHPVNVLVELCAYCAAFLPSLIDRGWLIPEKIRQDKYGHLYQVIPINNSINIILRPELISEYWRHTMRISADGYAIGGCEPLTRSTYSDLSVGNIQKDNIVDLYRKSLESQFPFHLAMLSLDKTACRNKLCFQSCLGGDALLSKAIYDDYNRKDPNCIWEEYVPKNRKTCSTIDLHPLFLSS
jgi:MoaA/NifB/PqqE/SkfB family radical SAM enzyme